MTRPILPNDLESAVLPVEIIEAFNEVIAKNWDGFGSIVRETESEDLISPEHHKLLFRGTNYHDYLNLTREAFSGWEVDGIHSASPAYYMRAR